MFRQYRNIEKGEFIIIAGDCSQGGADDNFTQFFSKTKLDIPLVYQKKGVAAEMTTAIYPVLNRLFEVTGVKPLVAFERNNGGASEMQRLDVLNREGKYDLYKMITTGTAKTEVERTTEKLGWDTNTATRPTMLGDWKVAFDGRLVTIYDQETLDQHKSFIVNKRGKPEAANNQRDDAVIACAIAWQIHQMSAIPSTSSYKFEEPEWASNTPSWSKT